MSGRLPSLTRAGLDETQRKLYDSLVANELPWAEKSGFEAVAPDGSLLGPFNPILFSPVLGRAMLDVFHADKTDSSLSPRVHEIVVLTVGAVWSAEYELYAHSAVARALGLSEALIEAIVSGGSPAFQSDQEAVAHDFTRQLAHGHHVDPETYARAVRLFGSKGLVDMVMLIGLYLTVCAIINAFEIATPEAARL
jgi:4-carboxymuconolactone decarboxylase